MQRDFTLQRRLIVAGLAVLVLADIALAAYSWHMASATRSPKQELEQLSAQFRLLKADVDRAHGIQARMPKIRQDCDQFEKSLPSEGTGYSIITADLSAVAHKAGVQLLDQTFREKEVKGRPLDEVVLEASVVGDYKNVMQFLNGLQRAKNLYVLDGLVLDAAQVDNANSPIKVALHLKTYFRTTG